MAFGRKRHSAAFARLRHRVYREYRRKGYSEERARYIAQATAGEVANRKHHKHRG